MNTVHVLDCTLRDGGYCNQWQFGHENTKKIILGLMDANIEIIECGFLTDKEEYNQDITKFNTLEQVAKVIPKKREGRLFVLMLNYGEYDIDRLPNYDGSSIDGFRIAFHKKDLSEAMEVCRRIIAKGYKVFVQAMVSLCYTDSEFLTLIEEVNKIEPYAFYIVDSFGMMKGKDLTRLFYMVEHNLQDNIWIGFHSHNNIQLAYSNAQTLVGLRTNRNLIIDSSVYGMGRGAGNLNTELFIDYLNANYQKKYQLKPLLTIIDDILNDFYQQNYWGYSLPNYIAAMHNAHPNYAGYLDDKKTLTVENMNEIFDMMNEDKRYDYDKVYIEELYLKFMEKERTQEEHLIELKQALKGKRVILIAPGKSSVDQKQIVEAEARKENTITISINHEYKHIEVNYIFTSNIRRFKELSETVKHKCIVTSNIATEGIYLMTKYKNLICTEEAVRDNAGLMAIKFLINYGVAEILLVGFDGYSHETRENYADKHLSFETKNTVLDAMNIGMEKVLKEYAGITRIRFLTTPRNVKI